MSVAPDTTADRAAQYRAALQDSVLADRSDLGRLLVSGRDALDLLHRLTTQDLRSLEPGTGAAAVFVTPKGRILDWVTVHLLEDRLLCVTGPGRSAAVAEFIERYTFREDVRVENADRTHATLGFYGATARERVERLFGAAAAKGPLHHPVTVRFAGEEIVMTRAFPLAGGGFHLTARAEALPALEAAILERASGIVEAGPACVEVLRIEAGLPAAGRELTEEHNPWEACLGDSISLNKGCYVGQEVIARLNTYKKVSKLLVRLRIPGDRAPAPGADLLGERGESVGMVTSAVTVPGEGRVAGLGFVRHDLAVEGPEVAVGDGGRSPRATILGIAR